MSIVRTAGGAVTSWRSSSTTTIGLSSSSSASSRWSRKASFTSAGARIPSSDGLSSPARSSDARKRLHSRCGSLQSAPSAAQATRTPGPRRRRTQSMTRCDLPVPGPPHTNVTARRLPESICSSSRGRDRMWVEGRGGEVRARNNGRTVRDVVIVRPSSDRIRESPHRRAGSPRHAGSLMPHRGSDGLAVRPAYPAVSERAPRYPRPVRLDQGHGAARVTRSG